MAYRIRDKRKKSPIRDKVPVPSIRAGGNVLLDRRNNQAPIQVVFISDVHFGHAKHAAKYFARTLEWLRTHPKAYWVGLGDLVENVTPDKNGLYGAEQRLSPENQVVGFTRMMKPLAPRCLGIVAGNHELRTLKQSGVELGGLIAHALGIPEKYLGHGGLYALWVGTESYLLSLHHGYRYSESNKFAEHERRFRIRPEVDLYAMGHTHDLDRQENVKLVWDSPSASEKAAPYYFLRTGNYLKYPDYANRAAHRPGRVGSPIVTFYGDIKKIEIDDQTLAAI